MSAEFRIVVFDGMCNLCSSVVDFISARDPRNAFTFVPMQSLRGQELLETHGVSIDRVDTFLLIRGDGCDGRRDDGNGNDYGSDDSDDSGGGYDNGSVNGEALVRSDAAIAIAAELRRPWNLLTVLSLLPRPVRDWVYSFVASNRYQWFGKRATCKNP